MVERIEGANEFVDVVHKIATLNGRHDICPVSSLLICAPFKVKQFAGKLAKLGNDALNLFIVQGMVSDPELDDEFSPRYYSLCNTREEADQELTYVRALFPMANLMALMHEITYTRKQGSLAVVCLEIDQAGEKYMVVEGPVNKLVRDIEEKPETKEK